MHVGDTILQQAYLPPVRWLSVKIVMGVRVIEAVSTERQVVFTYATLNGHLERGTASWKAQLHGDEIRFIVQTRSEPANPLARLVAPVFSLRYQAWVTRTALANMARQFAQDNPNWVM